MKRLLKKMIQNGINIARINFSHGSFESHQKVINLLRQTAKSLNKRIVILGEFPFAYTDISHVVKYPSTHT
jgi:pyruvate kinase